MYHDSNVCITVVYNRKYKDLFMRYLNTKFKRISKQYSLFVSFHTYMLVSGGKRKWSGLFCGILQVLSYPLCAR